MKAVNHQTKKFCSGQDHVYRQTTLETSISPPPTIFVAGV